MTALRGLLGVNPDYFLLLAIDPLESDCETFAQELARRSWQGGRRCPGAFRTLLK